MTERCRVPDCPVCEIHQRITACLDCDGECEECMPECTIRAQSRWARKTTTPGETA